MYSFSKTNDVLTVFIDGKIHTVNKDDSRFADAWSAVKANDEEKLKLVIDNKYIESLVNQAMLTNGVSVVDGRVFYNGVEQSNVLVKKIQTFIHDGAPIEHLIAALNKFMQNPSLQLPDSNVLGMLGLTQAKAERLRDDLVNGFWSFVDHENLPVTPEGNILAYKRVRDDYYSTKSGDLELLQGKSNEEGYIYNGVGETIECKRQDVNPDRNQVCSYGLHVGCLNYAGPSGAYSQYGDRTVIVEFSPEDVVSVPTDYNCEKLRLCKYKVIGEFEKPLQSSSTATKEKVKDEYILPQEIRVGDIISFTYHSKNRSHVLVSGIVGGTLFCNTDDGYRNFVLAKLANVKLEKDE